MYRTQRPQLCEQADGVDGQGKDGGSLARAVERLHEELLELLSEGLLADGRVVSDGVPNSLPYPGIVPGELDGNRRKEEGCVPAVSHRRPSASNNRSYSPLASGGSVPLELSLDASGGKRSSEPSRSRPGLRGTWYGRWGSSGSSGNVPSSLRSEPNDGGGGRRRASGWRLRRLTVRCSRVGDVWYARSGSLGSVLLLLCSESDNDGGNDDGRRGVSGGKLRRLAVRGSRAGDAWYAR